VQKVFTRDTIDNVFPAGPLVTDPVMVNNIMNDRMDFSVFSKPMNFPMKDNAWTRMPKEV
jgi:hypothetical protein